ncbi:unnamed protein product [Effrenium voratum]|nr:unnamed protein product [Effrenium voratum]
MEIFDVISGGKQRIKYADLAAHHKKAKNQPPEEKSEMSRIYEIIDADKSGSISKFEIIEAVKVKAEVAKFLLPHMESAQKVMESEEAFDEINSLFQTIAGGKKRIDFADFEAYFKKGQVPSTVRASAMERKDTRVFVIGPGFGQQLNPRQSGMVTTAGYQVQFFHGIPNPETKNFDALPYLEKIKEAIESFQPHVVCAASKGGVYMVGLWKAGYWRGPSLLLNAHPACTELPQDVPVVLAHGGNDEVYSTARERLEKLIATGTENKCFLYYTANSGRLPTGQCTRMGDKHNMESLLTRDCLPRLIDATLSEAGPEAHIQRSWRERLSEERLEAEDYLGFHPEPLRRRWVTRGMEDRKLHEVPRGSEEFAKVGCVFKAVPKEMLAPVEFLTNTQPAAMSRRLCLFGLWLTSQLQHDAFAGGSASRFGRSRPDGAQGDCAAHIAGYGQLQRCWEWSSGRPDFDFCLGKDCKDAAQPDSRHG